MVPVVADLTKYKASVVVVWSFWREGSNYSSAVAREGEGRDLKVASGFRVVGSVERGGSASRELFPELSSESVLRRAATKLLNPVELDRVDRPGGANKEQRRDLSLFLFFFSFFFVHLQVSCWDATRSSEEVRIRKEKRKKN